VEQSAIFVHALDITAFDFDAGNGVGDATTIGADIVAGEPREGLRRCGDECDGQSQCQAQPANAGGQDKTEMFTGYPPRHRLNARNETLSCWHCHAG
jgi:hypothetical protein